MRDLRHATVAWVKPALIFISMWYLISVVEGVCDEVCIRNDCPDVYDPVCASNNKTFKNDCVFMCELCNHWQTGTSVVVSHRGTCNCTETKACTDNFTPVCGTDNNDYPNICYLQLADSCRTDMNITVKNSGSCDPDPADPLCQSKVVCAAMYAPVCGTDGITYGNACLLYAGNVCRKDEDRAAVDYSGECRSLLKTWMTVAIISLVILALVLFCCIFLLRKSKRGGSNRYDFGRGKEEL